MSASAAIAGRFPAGLQDVDYNRERRFLLPARILYLLPALGAGGAELSLLELLRRIDRKRFEPAICCLVPDGNLVDAFRALDIPVHCFTGLHRHEFRGLRLPPVMLQFRPDIVHTRLVVPNLWGRLMGRTFRAKVITEERGVELARQRWMKALNRVTSPLSDVELANSEAVRRFMRDVGHVPEHRLRVIRGGVDVERFTPASPNAVKDIDVVSVGRLEGYKGITEFLEAARQILARRPGTTFLWIGTGSALEEARAQARKLGIAQAVQLPGYAGDVPETLRRSRLFVTPSHSEGLPNAVMEAMSAGLPVVASDIAAHHELIRALEMGTFVPAGDATALAEAILRTLDYPEEAARQGEAGRARALAEFSFDRVTRDYEALYEELLRA